MIAHLRGKLISKQPGQAIVEAAGVGYDVAISVPTFTALPLCTYTPRSAKTRSRSLAFSNSKRSVSLSG
jgi:Holliday junction resolvasome RuvABC DNA-binding subunit